jgi:hypothetical protein
MHARSDNPDCRFRLAAGALTRPAFTAPLCVIAIATNRRAPSDSGARLRPTAPDATGRTRVALLLFVRDERLVGSELHCRICVEAVALP